MKIGVLGVAHTTPSTTTLPLRLLRPLKVTCFSSSGHVSFIKDVVATQPPQNLHYLFKMFQTRGETIIFPGSRKGLIPLVVPLSENLSGLMKYFLVWNIFMRSNSGADYIMKYSKTVGISFKLLVSHFYFPGRFCNCTAAVANCSTWVDQYIRRILVEEDANNFHVSNSQLYDASSEAGQKLYRKGDFTESQIANLDQYILKKVGLFPDVLECKVKRHFEQGDHVSAMVTGEFSRVWTPFCILCRDFAEGRMYLRS